MVETVNVDTTVAVTGSTITNITSTPDIRIVATSVMLPCDVQARYYSSTILASSTVLAASGTFTSGTYDISRYGQRVLSTSITGNANSSMTIQVTPVAGGALNNLNTIALPSGFSSTQLMAYNSVGVVIVSGTIGSTISAWVGVMA